MKCKLVKEMMGPYLYGDLTPDEMRVLRLHMQDCEECREDLASRGRVTAALNDAVPQLTDEERQRIAWSVKGAIRAKEQARRPLGSRLAPFFALAGVLVIGFGLGALINSRTAKTPPEPRGTTASTSRATVTITEQQPEEPRMREKTRQDRTAARPDDEQEEQRGIRSGRTFFRVPVAISSGLTARKGQDTERAVTPPPDKPLTVAPSPDEPEPSADTNGTALPEPTDPNNAETEAPTPEE